MSKQPLSDPLSFEDILAQVTIRDILEDAGIQADRNRIPCPIHGGTNPTAFSFTDSGYCCFSCGASGGLVDLVQTLQGLSRAEAFSYLATLAGFSLSSSILPGTKARAVRPIARAPTDPRSSEIINHYESLKLYREALDCDLRVLKRAMREGRIDLADFYSQEQNCLYRLEESDEAFNAATYEFHQIRRKQK